MRTSSFFLPEQCNATLSIYLGPAFPPQISLPLALTEDQFAVETPTLSALYNAWLGDNAWLQSVPIVVSCKKSRDSNVPSREFSSDRLVWELIQIDTTSEFNRTKRLRTNLRFERVSLLRYERCRLKLRSGTRVAMLCSTASASIRIFTANRFSVFCFFPLLFHTGLPSASQVHNAR